MLCQWCGATAVAHEDADAEQSTYAGANWEYCLKQVASAQLYALRRN